MIRKYFAVDFSPTAASILLAGCMALAAMPFQALGADPSVTFSKDVAPIFQKACQDCHHPGSIAPMSLMTYKDSRPWARSIQQNVVSRTMPPWHIDRNIGITKFKNDPSLSDAEVAMISKWVEEGAPEGNPADMPVARQFSELDKWHLGSAPDIVVAMPKPYMLKAKGGDEYYDVEIDPGFKEDMYVSAVETKPDLGFKVVHHATTNLIEDEEADPTGLFLNEYAVGKSADIFPPNSGRLIKAGSKIHWNLHLHPDGEETPVQISMAFKLYPKGQVPKYVAFTQHMGDTNELDIPPGQVSREDGYFRLQQPAVLTAFQPHFHTLGKAQCVEAVFPDVNPDSARPGAAKTIPISCVSNYRFGWSITYPYADDAAPVLPAGTLLHITTWHDNTDHNPHALNPKNWVGSGQRTIDEMSFAWISLYYIDQADYNQRIAAKKKAGTE
jgi:hypothetical protein